MNSLNYLLKSHELKVVEYSINDSNGGSVRLYISHTDSERNESQSFKFALNESCMQTKVDMISGIKFDVKSIAVVVVVTAACYICLQVTPYASLFVDVL